MMGEKATEKIGPGVRCGFLTVQKATNQRKNGYTVWQCTCDCGGTLLLDTRTLQRGTVRDCGCTTRIKPGQRDLTLERFGKLTAVEATEARTEKGVTVWRCRCDCGNEVLVPLTQLTQGYRKSCGCLSNPPRKDYIGKKFGRLTVLDYAGKRNGMHYWTCRCDCGNQTQIGQTPLQSGKTQSCGCLRSDALVQNMKYIEGTSVIRLEQATDRLIATNRSGHNGVYWNRKTQKWAAQIGFKGKTYYLGTYHKLEDAVKARRKAEDRLYGEFLQWYYESTTEKT